MSLYLAVFAMLLVFSGIEYWYRAARKPLYWVGLVVIGAMLCLRFGQGTDYFGYYYNFLHTPPLWQPVELLTTSVHGEPGWLLVCSLFRTLHIPFAVLVFLISAAEMVCLHRFVAHYSPLWCVSLLLAYPTLYLTYAMSALRQGLVLMVFLGFMLDWLYRGKWRHYLIAAAVCALIHSSALVFLVLPAAKFVKLDTKKILILLAAGAVGGFALRGILPLLSESLAYYANAGMSLAAIGERAFTTLLVLYSFRGELGGKLRCHPKLQLLLQTYMYGSIIYSALMWNALLSSRFAVYFKAVEIVLFAIAVVRKDKLRHVVAACLLCLTVVMYFKNINSYIGQGAYFAFVNVWNYPYFTFFNKSAAELWREIPYNFASMF